MKNPKGSVEYTILKQWKPILLVVKNILLTKIQVSEKLNKRDYLFYQVVLFVATENQPSLKIKKFQMISLKWIKFLTIFYWLETNICQNCI